jgi:hypothetical protein
MLQSVARGGLAKMTRYFRWFLCRQNFRVLFTGPPLVTELKYCVVFASLLRTAKINIGHQKQWISCSVKYNLVRESAEGSRLLWSSFDQRINSVTSLPRHSEE